MLDSEVRVCVCTGGLFDWQNYRLAACIVEVYLTLAHLQRMLLLMTILSGLDFVQFALDLVCFSALMFVYVCCLVKCSFSSVAFSTLAD